MGAKKKKDANISVDDIGKIAEALKDTLNGTTYSKQEIEVKTLSLPIPAGLRLGECIVDGMAFLAKKNNVFNEDFITALHHISDKDLVDSIIDSHKPYGFARK